MITATLSRCRDERNIVEVSRTIYYTSCLSNRLCVKIAFQNLLFKKQAPFLNKIIAAEERAEDSIQLCQATRGARGQDTGSSGRAASKRMERVASESPKSINPRLTTNIRGRKCFSKDGSLYRLSFSLLALFLSAILSRLTIAKAPTKSEQP